jgi:RNA polymerase sigma factor (sigma-70 family)
MAETTMDAAAELAARARAGDRDAFDELAARVAERVSLFVRLRLGGKLRASVEEDDVLQDAWLAAFEDFGRLEWRGEDAFAHWVCRLTENRIRGMADHYGAKKRNPSRGFARASDVVEAVRASATGPATAAERTERNGRLARAMERLDEDEREALLHRHFEDRPVAEIAALMGRSPSATTRLLGRATSRLGELMAERT